MEKNNHPYITRKEGVCGGKPIIEGTRIRVQDIVIEYNQMGLTPDEIIQAHPHLTLAQVHDALSFYYDHAEEIISDIRKSEKLAENIEIILSTSEKARFAIVGSSNLCRDALGKGQNNLVNTGGKKWLL